MMKQVIQITWAKLLVLPIALTFSACLEDNPRGVALRNNQGGYSTQQDARAMQPSGRNTRNTTAQFNTGTSQMPQSFPPVSQNPQPNTTAQQSKTSAPSVEPARFVVKAPQTAQDLCEGLKTGRKPWPNFRDPELDNISSFCEALIMSHKYGQGATAAEFNEYEAIHPQRVNGFLVAAAIFQNDDIGLFNKADFKMFKKAKDPKEVKDQIKENRRRNKDLGANENESKYSKHFWDRFFELKNEGERDVPALKRMFFGLSVNDEKIENYDELKPQFAQVTTPINRVSIDNKASSPIATGFENHIGFVKGGDVEPIALGAAQREGTLQNFAGMAKETTNQRLDGSFIYVAETNLVLREDTRMAIGHKVMINGEEVYRYGASLGSFIVFVDGEKVLYSLDTIRNSSTPVVGQDYVDLYAKQDAGCRSTNVVIVFIPSSDKEHDKSGATAISDSVFFAEAGTETFKPLHQGILSALPVQTALDEQDAKDLACKSWFFDQKVTGIQDNMYVGDTYVKIESTEVAGDKVFVKLDIYGVDPDMAFVADNIKLEGNNINEKSLTKDQIKVTPRASDFVGTKSYTFSIQKDAFWGDKKEDPAILKTLTIDPAGDTKETHVWNGKKTLLPNG